MPFSSLTKRMDLIIKNTEMLTIDIIEDQEKDKEKLIGYLNRYSKEQNTVFNIRHYPTGSAFLFQYKSDADIVFRDIERPGINGFETACQLRKRDTKVLLIFLTNLSQYAIKGYSVDAFDYISKPVSYESFETRRIRAIKKAHRDRKRDVRINSLGHFYKVDIRSITFIEVINHKLIYHTDEQSYTCWGTLSSIKEDFLKRGFASGSASSLINLRRVYSLAGNKVTLNDGKKTEIYLSRSQKNEFAKAFTDYVSGD